MQDLPVFVSADSIMHAVHRSYDGILESVEQAQLNRRPLEVAFLLTQLDDTKAQQHYRTLSRFCGCWWSCSPWP